MSIKVQKIILFIPIVNFVSMFCFLGMCFKRGIAFKEYLIVLLKMFGAVILLTIPRIIVSFAWENYIANQILLWVTVYCYFFVLALIAIQAQEKFGNQRKTGDGGAS